MDGTSALLRIAALAAGASAALLIRRDEGSVVAAWRAAGEAADALLRLRAGEAAGDPSLFTAYPLELRGGVAAEVLLVDAHENRPSAVAPIIVEIARICDPGATRTGDLERLTDALEQFADAAAVLRRPADIESPATVISVNAAFTRLLGYRPEEIAGRPVSLLWGEQTDESRVRYVRQRMLEGQPVTTVHAFYARDGSPVWLEATISPLENAFFVCTYRDVTNRMQFEESLASQKRKLQTTLAAIADAVVTALDDGRVEFVNGAAQRLLGIELEDAYGEALDRVVRVTDDDGAAIDIVRDVESGTDGRRGEGRLLTAKGVIDVAYVASRVEGANGYVVVLRDVTAEHRIASKLSFDATHDPLTGLPNRRALLERLESAVHGAREHGAHGAIAFLDLDRFKIVNDRFGHAVGDRLLREVSEVMGRSVRGADVLARIGGDEFALLLSDCRVEDARRVAEKMRAAVDAYRISHGGEELSVGVSIGIAPIDAGTLSASQVLEDADGACYRAKAAGRNAVAG